MAYHWYIILLFLLFWSLIIFTRLLIILSFQNLCIIFYLQHPSSHKCFDPWGVECLLSLLESWAPASSLTTFKLAWKTAILLAVVTAKCCSDLTLLCIDNQHLFLQCHAAIFIPLSGGKTDCLGHLPLHICIESHTNVNLCPFFI